MGERVVTDGSSGVDSIDRQSYGSPMGRVWVEQVPKTTRKGTWTRAWVPRMALMALMAPSEPSLRKGTSSSKGPGLHFHVDVFRQSTTQGPVTFRHSAPLAGGGAHHCSVCGKCVLRMAGETQTSLGRGDRWRAIDPPQNK